MFLSNIALYSIETCFHYPSHLQQGVVFALAPSLHSFWSYFSSPVVYWAVHLSVSSLFAFSFCSWGSHGKNTEAVQILKWLQKLGALIQKLLKFDLNSFSQTKSSQRITAILDTWTRKYRTRSLSPGNIKSSQHKNTQNINLSFVVLTSSIN